MEIELYWDSLLLLNFFINLCVLSLLWRKFTLCTSKIRVICAALLGAICYVLLLLVPIKWVFGQFVMIGCSVFLMTFVMVPKRKRRLIGKMIGYGFFYSFVFAGVIRAVLGKWKIFVQEPIGISFICVMALICVWIGGWYMKTKAHKKKKSLCDVYIESAGTNMKVKALLDTGNSLREPISKQPVCLIEETLLAKITLENPMFFRAIPFHSVGCMEGMLYGVQIPKITIYIEDDIYVIEQAVCAGIHHPLSSNGAYQMILHPDLIAEEHKIKMKV